LDLNNSYRGVRSKVVHIPFPVVRIGVVSHFGEEQDGRVVVSSECRVVHGKDVNAALISANFNVNSLGSRRSGVGRYLKPRLGCSKIVLLKC
jgi:hypothetical protein